MAFDVEGARKEGYSDEEIAQHLAQQSKFNYTDAKNEGYSDSEILGHLTGATINEPGTITRTTTPLQAAEIGGAAMAQNLGTSRSTAEQLAASGITKQQAQQGYGTIAGMLPTATQLSDIYGAQGVGPYTQATAEADVFGTSGSSDATKLRKKLAQLEQAQFSAQSGTANTGGGGGGGNGGASGGSGIVIARYQSGSQQAYGGTIVSSGGYYYHTFTSSGNFITSLPKATGGTIYSDSTYYYHVFNATGAFTPNTNLTNVD